MIIIILTGRYTFYFAISYQPYNTIYVKKINVQFFGINRLLRFSMNKHIIIKLLNQPHITDTSKELRLTLGFLAVTLSYKDCEG
jgi:hypothetical protein